MHVYLTGATGAVGRPLVRQLVARGHEVTATTRSEAKIPELEALGARAVAVDGLDAAAVGEAVATAQPDAIVHQMTALAGKPDLRRFDRWFATTNELRTKGTEHLLAAAHAAGVERVVAQSYTGWPYARTGGPVKTEDDPYDPDPARWQRASLEAIRFVDTAVPERAAEGIVLRYGNFYGPGASDEMVEIVRKRRMPIVGDGGGIWSWIHVDDAASAAVAAVERGGNGVYNVADDEPASEAEWLPYLAAAVGARPPRRIPVWLARLAAGDVVVRMMTEARGASNAKARRELGWEPRWASWRDGFRHALDGEPAKVAA
jgi:nucleoside-diphosphate-sugar epimerase